MRNLKRALSLTLASVMLLGMMVVGSSAKGYDDVKETDNVEAIEVAQAIEVMVGDERGFGPDRPVNRAEMAVVMGKLLNLDYDYYATSCPFNDVYDWARGYVGRLLRQQDRVRPWRRRVRSRRHCDRRGGRLHADARSGLLPVPERLC